MILISLPDQRLELLEESRVVVAYPVSTARNGPGEQRGSGCTPRGWHRVRLKIGAGLPLNTVFVGRRPTGEIYDSELAARHPERDWILTRILWLTGLESGYNRGGEYDTLRRFIYIHGCPDTTPMGEPLSHGCIRMRNPDLLELFEQIKAGERVFIANGADARPRARTAITSLQSLAHPSLVGCSPRVGPSNPRSTDTSSLDGSAPSLAPGTRTGSTNPPAAHSPPG